MVIVSDDSNTIELKIGQKYVYVNDIKKAMDTKAIIKRNRTFVPLSFISQQFGYKVEWDNSSRSVLLTSNNKIAQVLNLSEINYKDNSSNVNNHTLINTDGKYLYYSNIHDKYKLYRLNLKTGISTLFYNKSDIFDIYLLDDYIAFSFFNYDNNCFDIGKISYDGVLINTYENVDRDRLRVYKNLIYYTVDKHRARYLYKIEGDNTKKLAQDVNSFLINDDKIYFSENDNIYSMSLKGSERILLLRDANALDLTLKGNLMYYYDMFNNESIFYFDLDTKKSERINVNRYICFWTVYDNNIYFSDNETGLYKYDINTNTEELIFEGVVVNPCIIGECLFFHRNDGIIVNYIYSLKSKKIIKLK